MPEYADYPKTLVHRSYAPAILGRGAYEGAPARFSPVTVNSPMQEEELRSKGYMAAGESAPSHSVRVDYPKMMIHPDHVPAVPDAISAYKDDEGIKTKVTPGAPEKYPPVVVKDAAEEAAWAAKGWGVPAKPDPEAFVSAHAVPEPLDRHDVDGNQYPKWVNGVIVNSAAEERALRGGTAPEQAIPVEHKAYLEAPKTVDAEEHEKALKELADLRAQLAAKEAAPETPKRQFPQPDREAIAALQAQCVERGIDFDKRWGVKRLTEVLE